MKLFGFAQCLGVLLIIALLFGFLGSREEAETLKTALAKEEKEHLAAREEGQDYHDQVIGLQTEVKASAEKEAALTGEIDELAKAKTGIENTMKTQIANLEQANSAAEKAKADLDTKLVNLEAAGKAKEEELTIAITEAKGLLAKSQKDAAKLKASLEDLGKAKADIETKLKDSADALQKAKSEMEALKTQLDQAEKSKSDLQKGMDDLKKALEAKEKEAKEKEAKEKEAKEKEAKEKEAKEKEDETKDANNEVSALSSENLRLKAALKSSGQKFVEIRNFVDKSQPVLQDNTVASGSAIREDDLRRQLDKERKDSQAVAKVLKELLTKVREIQGDLAAQTADL
ncbi:MAG: chromosome segregation ATPase [Verrucomicrobiales bacterium]|jgi:chromosome segregation ATPase